MALAPAHLAGSQAAGRAHNEQEQEQRRRQQEDGSRCAARERRRASQRIKLSRELMVRLSAAMGVRRLDCDGQLKRQHPDDNEPHQPRAEFCPERLKRLERLERLEPHLDGARLAASRLGRCRRSATRVLAAGPLNSCSRRRAGGAVGGDKWPPVLSSRHLINRAITDEYEYEDDNDDEDGANKNPNYGNQPGGRQRHKSTFLEPAPVERSTARRRGRKKQRRFVSSAGPSSRQNGFHASPDRWLRLPRSPEAAASLLKRRHRNANRHCYNPLSRRCLLGAKAAEWSRCNHLSGSRLARRRLRCSGAEPDRFKVAKLASTWLRAQSDFCLPFERAECSRLAESSTGASGSLIDSTPPQPQTKEHLVRPRPLAISARRSPASGRPVCQEAESGLAGSDLSPTRVGRQERRLLISYEKPSVILEPPAPSLDRIARPLASQRELAPVGSRQPVPQTPGRIHSGSAEAQRASAAAGTVRRTCSHNYDLNSDNNNSSNDHNHSHNNLSGRARKQRHQSRSKSPLRGNGGGGGDEEACDSHWLGSARKRLSRPLAATCWRRALLWMLLGGALLALAPPISRTTSVSGQVEQRRRPPASDEFRDTVLATMSTQSPTAAEDAPPANLSTGAEEQVTDATGFQVPTSPLPPDDLLERLLTFCRIFVMGAIIVGDICGNSLVILSVCRHSKLRVTTNWFVVSLACADILVALFAMTFNASVIVSGRWLFSPWVCDFWNSCDVLASTASILHLCCISIDRYIAITRPLDYPMKITTRRVVYALCGVWISSALLSYIPIFTGVYTTAEHIKWLEENPDQCDFVVNRVYAVVSSSISFWIPSSIMVFTYYRIYKEATRQEKFIYKAQSMMPAPMSNHQPHNSAGNHSAGARTKQRRSKSMAFSSSAAAAAVGTAASNEARIRQLARQQHELQRPQLAGKPTESASNNLLSAEPGVATTELSQPAPVGERASSLLQLADSGALSAGESEPLRAPPAAGSKLELSNSNSSGGGGGAAKTGRKQQVAKVSGAKRRPNSNKVAFDEEEEEEEDDEDQDSASGQSTPTKRSISKMKREHKAAKTLGIIMGVFILCWLPFFSWYTPQHICGHACDGIVPRGAVTILFWIGYFNSTLNPIIYAYFNHEFRDAFKKTLQWIFCCCNDLKCLRVNRPNDNQHYNCTYRSTQEIGLVSNG